MNNSIRIYSIILITLLVCFASSCRFVNRGHQPTFYTNEEWKEKEIQALVATMTNREKASQIIMTCIDGKTEFPSYLYKHFQDCVPGAVLLFRYNIADTPESVFGFLKSADSAFASLGQAVPVLFAIDHEGGDVLRTGSVATKLPSARLVAEHLLPATAARLYEASGRQLALLGIRMNLAPVMELGTPLNEKFLGSRTFSDDPAIVAKYVSAAISGYRNAGVITVAKHFPGNSGEDPHTGSSVLDITSDQFYSQYYPELVQTLASSPDALLVSHVIVSSLEEGTPYCLSKKGVTGIIREKAGFDGLIITDDISMKAISSCGLDSSAAAIRALEAGCDMIMTSETDIRTISFALESKAESDSEFQKRLDSAVYRILELKYRCSLVKPAIRRYGESRMKEKNANSGNTFDNRAFSDEKKNGDRITEGLYGIKQ